MPSNILITSISSKVPLIKRVIESKNKFNKHSLIYGGDIHTNVIGKNFVDKFWLMPRLNDLTVEIVTLYCKINNISYIIPTRDEDVFFFSVNKKKLRKNGIFTFNSHHKSVTICFDKLKFYKTNKNLNIIPTFKNIKNIKEKQLVIKERFGSGSAKIAININKKYAKKYAKKLQEVIYQPYIEGQEYSVDSYLSKERKVIAMIVRSRDVIKDGEAIVTTYEKDKMLEALVKSLINEFKIYGHSVTQAIKDKDGVFHIIECNARFGGASTLSYEMGLESFYWFFCESINRKIKFTKKFTKLKQIRVTEDIYIES